MKTILIAFMAMFIMFLGTSYAEATPTAPADLYEDSYLLTDEMDFNAIDSNVFSSYVQCVESEEVTDFWYCNQTPGCPMCVEIVKMEKGLPESSIEEDLWSEEDYTGFFNDSMN